MDFLITLALEFLNQQIILRVFHADYVSVLHVDQRAALLFHQAQPVFRVVQGSVEGWHRNELRLADKIRVQAHLIADRVYDGGDF